MKTKHFTLLLAMLGALLLASCADQAQTTSNRTTPTTPGQRTYDRNDIDRTGRQTTGGAVQGLDPAAHVSGGN